MDGIRGPGSSRAPSTAGAPLASRRMHHSARVQRMPPPRLLTAGRGRALATYERKPAGLRQPRAQDMGGQPLCPRTSAAQTRSPAGGRPPPAPPRPATGPARPRACLMLAPIGRIRVGSPTHTLPAYQRYASPCHAHRMRPGLDRGAAPMAGWCVSRAAAGVVRLKRASAITHRLGSL